jgi:hypothetical protein
MSQHEEDEWESALANVPNLEVPTPPPPENVEQTAPMPAVAPKPDGQLAPLPPQVLQAPQAQATNAAQAPIQGQVAQQAPIASPVAGQLHPHIVLPIPPEYVAPTRKPQPLIGPVLTVYGALLWSFVVAGQFTTSWMSSGPLGEGWAVLIVMVSTLSAGIWAIVRSHRSQPATPARLVGRTAFAFVGGLVAWFATVFVAAIAGNVASRNHDILIAFVLVALAVTTSIAGPRLTAPAATMGVSHGRKVVLAMVWVGLAIVTLIAGAELASNG